MEQNDYILCECALDALEAFVRELESHHTVQIIRQPAVCMTMVRAEDSVESQPFYLGEVLVTDCEVQVDGQAGYGLCMGDEPVRCYCMAVIDALLLSGDTRANGSRASQVHAFLEGQAAIIADRQRLEYNLIQRTKVDFKLMEQD
jgi:alpha-D-ribose 1-methylphosphonate 5-triphosphate synthase subunit PhnG